MEQTQDQNISDTRSFSGLGGRELVEWALEQGEERCLEQIGRGSTQEKYFQAISRRVGVEWPPGFFECTLEELMDNR